MRRAGDGRPHWLEARRTVPAANGRCSNAGPDGAMGSRRTRICELVDDPPHLALLVHGGAQNMSIADSTEHESGWSSATTMIISRLPPSTFRTLNVPPSQKLSLLRGRFFGSSERTHASGSMLRIRQTWSSHLNGEWRRAR